MSNIKLSFNVKPPIVPCMLPDHCLHYYGGFSTYIIRHESYVFSLMAKGSFVNVTGIKYFEEIPSAIACLDILLSKEKLTFSNQRINTISAHAKFPQKVFLKLLQHTDTNLLFSIKQYQHMSCKINVQLLHPLKISPNLCANMFKSGGVCFFGARTRQDLETFLLIIHDFVNA